jgi:hypothetical protein
MTVKIIQHVRAKVLEGENSGGSPGCLADSRLTAAAASGGLEFVQAQHQLPDQ